VSRAWWSSGCGRIELRLTREEALSCCGPGSVDDEVEELSRFPHIAAQLETIQPEVLREELQGYGAWDDEQLDDHDANLDRVLWIACGDLIDNPDTEWEEEE